MLLSVEHVVKSFKKHCILHDFSYTFDAEKLYAVTGPSGCGKSTLLNLLGSLDQADKGTIFFHNQKIKKLDRSYLREHVSYLFQNYALIEDDTVEDNLKLALTYRKDVPAKKRKDCIQDALANVGLAAYEKRKVSTLSGGEQQRVALARILLKPCEIVLADEPTGNLDEDNRNIVLRILQELKRGGKCVIIATHDPYIAEHCDEIIRLKKS